MDLKKENALLTCELLSFNGLQIPGTEKFKPVSTNILDTSIIEAEEHNEATFRQILVKEDKATQT